MATGRRGARVRVGIIVSTEGSTSKECVGTGRVAVSDERIGGQYARECWGAFQARSPSYIGRTSQTRLTTSMHAEEADTAETVRTE